MIRSLYRALLRGPRFRGRHRLEAALRRLMSPPADRVAHGLVMELDPQEWLQIDLLACGALEPRTTELFRSLLRPGDACLDVGAHVGFHALVAAQAVGPQGRVVAVEPQPYNCDKILTNAELNGLANLVVVAAAAGEADGVVRLHNQKRNDKARLTLAGKGVSDVGTAFEVPIVRIDTVARRHGLDRVRLIKIDVEGYEAEVLRGAAATLAATDHLVFECLPETETATVEQIAATLRAAGFALRQLDGASWVPGQSAIENNIWASRLD